MNLIIKNILAHALGTFAGAFLAALIAANHKMKFAPGIGVFFLMGGIANTFFRIIGSVTSLLLVTRHTNARLRLFSMT